MTETDATVHSTTDQEQQQAGMGKDSLPPPSRQRSPHPDEQRKAEKRVREGVYDPFNFYSRPRKRGSLS